MYITIITDDYNDTLSINNNCTNDDNNIEIVIPVITILPCTLSFICLISLMLNTLVKPLFNKKNRERMDKILYPQHPVRCNITGPSECGESVFLTNLILNFINEYEKMYIYSPSFHQDLYQKLIKCFSNYISINIIKNILNEDDIDIVIEDKDNNKDFEKSNTEIETFDNIDELKFPQEYDD